MGFFLPGCCLYTERLKTSSVLIIPKALRNTSVRTPLNHSDRAGIRPELSFRQALLPSCPPTCLLIQSLRPVPHQQGHSSGAAMTLTTGPRKALSSRLLILRACSLRSCLHEN